jgi:hypothetical protein
MMTTSSPCLLRRCLAPLSFALLLTVPALGQGVAEAPFARLTEVVRELRLPAPRLELDAAELSFRCGQSLDAYAFLFGVLESRQVPAWEEEGQQTLSTAQADLVLAALSLAPPGRVQQVRDRRLAQVQLENDLTPENFAQASANARLAAIQVTSILGSEGSIGLMLELALIDGEGGLSTTGERVLEDSICRLLQSNPASAIGLELSKMDDRLVTPTLRALGRARTPGGYAFLEDILMWAPEHASVATAQLRVLGQSYNRKQNRRLSKTLVDKLDSLDPRYIITVCLALGGLRSEAGVEPLIELLGYEQEYPEGTDGGSTQQQVRDMAHWALVEITTRRFGPEPELWRLWIKEEQRWLQEESGFWLARLKSREVGVAAEAIRMISIRSFGRVELAHAIAEALAVGPAEIGPMACGALADLGCRSVVGQLAVALGSDSPTTSEAAWSALQRLTGLHLTNDPQAWSSALALQDRE